MGDSPTITCCMIVRDEEDNLPACVRSAADLVDEWLVYDTGSVDDTRAVANELGCTVVAGEWRDDFAWARNRSLEHATGDWIVVLDADDRLDDGAALRSLLGTDPDCDVFYRKEYVANARLGDGCVSLVEDDGSTVVLFPLGWAGEWGLARLDLWASLDLVEAPNSMSPWFAPPVFVPPWELVDPVWTAHLAKEGGMELTSVLRHFAAGIAASTDFVFVVVQPDGPDQGVAVYHRGPAGSYPYLGTVRMPDFEGTGSLKPLQIVAHEVDGASLLLVSLRLTLPPAQPSLASPHVLVFRFAGGTTFADVETNLDLGALDEETNLFTGQAYMTAVVESPLYESSDEAGSFRGLDVQLDADSGATLLAVSSKFGVEVFDISAVADDELDLQPYGAFETSEPSEPSNAPEVHVVGLDQRLATYAESAGPCDASFPPCGPPATEPTTLDYTNVNTGVNAESGLTFAGRYLLWATESGLPSGQGEAMRVLAMTWTGDLQDFQLRRVGLLQGDLGAGRQFEPLWRLNFDAAQNRVVGSVRSYVGYGAFPLPEQTDAECLLDDGVTASFYPQTDPCPDGGGCGVTQRTSAYPPGVALEVQTVGHTAPEVDCNELRSGGQLPGNVGRSVGNWSGAIVDAGLPDLIGYGYGGEWVGGTVGSRTRTTPGGIEVTDRVLFITDRGGCAVWAHAASLSTGLILDGQTIVRPTPPPLQRQVSIRDCAAGPWEPGSHDLRLAVCSSVAPELSFLKWSWGSGESGDLSVPLSGPPLLFFRNLEAASPDGGATWGMSGVTRVATLSNPLAATFPEMTHFACALDWRHRGDLDDPVAQAQWEEESWDLAFVPGTGAQGDDIVYWRLPREPGGYGVDASAVNTKLAAVPDPINIPAWPLLTGRRLLIQDLVQKESYLFALASSTPTDTSTGEVADYEDEDARLWLLTLQVGGSSGIGDTDHTDPSQTLPFLVDLVHLLPLHGPQASGGMEQKRLHASPDGRFLTASGGSQERGLFLIDTEAGTGPTPEPAVVWGLRRDGAWFGWSAADNSLSDDTIGPAGVGTRVGVYPEWPLLEPTDPDFPSPPVNLNCHSVPLFEADGELFFIADGSPLTLWHVPTASPSEVAFVGGFPGRDHRRVRVALTAGDDLFLVGDFGVVGLDSGGCADAAGPGCATVEA